MPLGKCQRGPDVEGVSVRWWGESTSTFVPYVVCPRTAKKCGHWTSCLPFLTQSGLDVLAVIYAGKWNHALGILQRKKVFMLSQTSGFLWIAAFKTAKLIIHTYLTACRSNLVMRHQGLKIKISAFMSPKCYIKKKYSYNLVKSTLLFSLPNANNMSFKL